MCGTDRQFAISILILSISDRAAATFTCQIGVRCLSPVESLPNNSLKCVHMLLKQSHLDSPNKMVISFLMLILTAYAGSLPKVTLIRGHDRKICPITFDMA